MGVNTNIGVPAAMSITSVLRFMANHPLTRDNHLQSLARFVKWQIGSRLAPGVIIYEWINGAKFLVKAGETGLTGNIYSGLQDFPEMGYLLHVLRDDDLFVDVGANSGSYTVLACAVAGARGLAIEPVPRSYSKLIENVRINHMESRVICLNVGVGMQAGHLSFTGDLDTANHVVASSEHSESSIQVEMRTLDDLLSGKSPSVMKMDVEGYETPALEGAKETLRNPALHSVVMELNGAGNMYGYDDSRIVAMMFDHGFRTYAYDPIERRLSEITGKNPSSDNTLFVRESSLIRERLATADRIRVLGTEF
jgi:FkbM family methyltransferase